MEIGIAFLVWVSPVVTLLTVKVHLVLHLVYFTAVVLGDVTGLT